MLVGLLRVEDGLLAGFFPGTGTDMPKLRALIGARLLPDKDPLMGQELPADSVAEAAVRRATAEAEAHRREWVSPVHLFTGILTQHGGPGARVLAEVGATEALLLERWKGVL